MVSAGDARGDGAQAIELRAVNKRFGDKLIYEAESQYHYIRVTQKGPLRTLFFRKGPAAKQSAVGMGVQVGAGAQAAADDAMDGPVRKAQDPSEVKQKPIRVDKTPGRNSPCPCGSGKKYKHCHGQ